MQNYFYDLRDRLVKAEIFKQDGRKETWVYTYDALSRRIAKAQTEVSDRHSDDNACLKNSCTEFLWDGSHLLQEKGSSGLYTYIYADVGSHEPLAQIHNWTNGEGESKQATNYFHCDQIGIPREMTDQEGNLLWFGDYYGWGKLKNETHVTGTTHQPFRLQNQYCDTETGLHYNFFRYYEPNTGRFVNQDPIRLFGGTNLYSYGGNPTGLIDSLGLATQDQIDRGIVAIKEAIANWRADDRSPKAKGSMVAVIVTKDGKVYPGCSAKTKHKDSDPPPLTSKNAQERGVAKAYNDLKERLPEGQLGKGHGQCAEVTCASDALAASHRHYGSDQLKGAITMAHTVSPSGEGKFVPACESCDPIMAELGVEDVVASRRVRGSAFNPKFG